ncbi:MAG: Lrp/AsnC ligand binding domain-containing protein [Tannerellaceae bacterium]|jgi:Lrp/AsnC family transcriptional regulator for asnA, asnC and gidA|nr:Lrp/AsnC ligand binding domain-containing protein [Tannerellaceae bacterium]
MKLPRPLDRLDRKILRIITGNARMPFKEVAEECGVSRAAVHQRVLRMIDAKAVIGSGYHVNPESLGYKSCTYIGVKLERGSLYKRIIPELLKISEIVECHYTTGPYTFLLKLYARDNEHLMELVNTRIQEIAGVTTTETMISLSQDIKRDVPVHEDMGPDEEFEEEDEEIETDLLDE